MSSVKHPRIKKDASLKKDHRVYPWEGDKTFRGDGKQKKRRMAKKGRAAVKVAVRLAESARDDKASARVKQPKSLRKTGIVSLARDLKIKKGEPQMRFTLFNYSNEEFTR